MIQEFIYTSSKGTNNRKVFVVKENDNFIEGIDLSLISPEEAKFITESYKDFVPRVCNDNSPIEGWNKDWNRAWRKFSKSKIGH